MPTQDEDTASSVVFTPTTSAAPSTINNPAVPKLPLAVRKNLRDEWENKQKEIESKLSSILGCPWRADIDGALLFSHATDSHTKGNLGNIITEYMEGATDRIAAFAATYGPAGLADLNRLAAHHTISIAPTSDPSIAYTACTITTAGALTLLFSAGNLGVNAAYSTDNLADALDAADVVANGGDVTVLGFHARHGIRTDYEPRIEGVKARVATALGLRVLALTPNWEANYAKLAGYVPRNYHFPREFQKSFALFTYEYFEGFADVLEELGFGTDEMLREGFRDGVEKNEVAVRVVDRLKAGEGYNGCVVENGVLYLQTTPENWAVNIKDPAREVINIL